VADHNHYAYEVYDAATSGDLRNAVSLAEGVRFDLGQAEERIRELESETAQLRRELDEVRERLAERVSTVQSVLAKYLADAGQPVSAESVRQA
jgi:predicted  nucleic acid-binding Zn-ribbon protein